jgi:hypothetical protein
MYNSSKIILTYNYNATYEKVKHGYICMYGVHKLLYRRPIFNSLATIIQLTNFDTVIYLLIHRISKGIIAQWL